MDLVWILAAIAETFRWAVGRIWPVWRWPSVQAIRWWWLGRGECLLQMPHLGSDGPGKTLVRIATGMREDASRAAAALPVTATWLSLYEPNVFMKVVLLSAVGTMLLRREISRVRASETVLAYAEAAFDRVTARVLVAGVPLRLTSTHQADFCTQACGRPLTTLPVPHRSTREHTLA